MNLQTLNNQYVIVPPDLVPLFVDEFHDAYELTLTRSYKRVPVPSDDDLLDVMQNTFRQIASYNMYNGDPYKWLDLKGDELTRFLAFSVNDDNHFNLRLDLLLYAKRERVFMFINDYTIFINEPTKEVW